MAEAGVAVALLFDDAALGDVLRTALQERGARIVHEGTLTGLTRQRVLDCGAEVLVVNLDDENDEALDRLYESIDGGSPRVVFNDAQASRALDGWDRARWARHLAMKVLAIGDADPPRPALPAGDEASPAIGSALSDDGAAQPLAEALAAEPIGEEALRAAASETLAAELEALLASEPPLALEQAFGGGRHGALGTTPDAPATGGDEIDLTAFAGLPEGLPSTPIEDDRPDGTAGDWQVQTEPFAFEAPAGAADFDEPVAHAPDAAVARTDGQVEVSLSEAARSASAGSDIALALGALSGSDAADEPWQLDVADTQAAPVSMPDVPRNTWEAGTLRPSDRWSLLDDDTLTVDAGGPPLVPDTYGIEKLSAADYLAPATDACESPISPGLTLELVSLEEALAPQAVRVAHEMVLDQSRDTLAHLVVLGATTESTSSVCDFLAALPAGLRATFLHTQHLAGRPAGALVEHLASCCALPVRMAEQGAHVRAGEVLVVPSDRQVRLGRDGVVELLPQDTASGHAPSIDVSFTLAATTFGPDALAILFAGRSTDAVGGCQAVHDRGGQVWVEAAGGDSADMVSGVQAERLSHYAGAPHQLAAHLVEYLSMEDGR